MEDLSKYPRVLRTKEDYEYARNNFPAEYWTKDFKKLIMDSIETRIVKICEDVHKVHGKDDVYEYKKSMDLKTTNPLYRYLYDLIDEDPGETLRIEDDENELRKYTTQHGDFYLLVHTSMKKDSKLERIGYTMDEAISASMGVVENHQDMQEKINKVQESLQKKIDEVENMTEEEFIQKVKESSEEESK